MQPQRTIGNAAVAHRSKAALLLAEALRNAGISYGVTSGIDGFPQTIGRDIDFLVHARDRLAVVQAATKAFRAVGWELATRRRINGHYWCFAVDRSTKTILEFDLAGPLQWGPCVFADRPFPDTIIGPFAVDSYARVVKRLILPLLAGRNEKISKFASEASSVSQTSNTMSKRLGNFFGADLASRFLAAVDARNADDLFKLAPQLRKAVFSRSILRPWKLPRALVNRVTEKLAVSPLEKPMAPVVAIVGPDGVGKSTVIHELRELLPQLLPINGVTLRHWRPFLLPPLARLAGLEVPQAGVAHPPRRQAGKFSWVRKLYYSLDFTLGTWLKDRPLSSFNKIIIYDRCYLDMQSDPLRFGLPDTKGLQSLAKLYQSPDLVVLLEDSPQRIRDRKPELSFEEIIDVYERWKVIGQDTQNFHILSASGGVEATAAQAADLIVEAAIQKLLIHSDNDN
jgi:hypothetical protein